MKHLIAVLLCLLLWGCGRKTPSVQPEAGPGTTAFTAMAGLYDPDHPMQQQYPGLVRAYPLGTETARGIRAFGKDVLALSGDSNTTLSLYTGENLKETTQITLNFFLDPEDPSLQIHQNEISYFDPLQQATIVLDHRLQQTRYIPAPMGLSGSPILCAMENTLYYCTGWSVVAWDLESGIRRTVKEMAYEHQALTGIHPDSNILECTIQNKGSTTKLLLTADQGVELRQLPENGSLYTRDDRYFCAITSSYQTLMLFGETEASVSLLLPADNWDQQFYLPEDHAVVTVCAAETGVQLDYYELNTGMLRSSLTLNAAPKAIINTKDHCAYILSRDSGDILYRWDVLQQPPDPANTVSFKSAYRTDIAALEACQDYADAIAAQYGITIRIGEEAAAVQPWDYAFQPETLAPVLQKELRLLEQRLAQYPQTILEQTRDHFTGLTICLVRSITGTGDERSLPSATGIQFFRDQEAYVVISTGRYSRQALYHELYHAMETHILTESSALDHWETLNPVNFTYQSQQPQESGIYLKGQTRAFVDHYSMIYPKEDRARVLENAILPGKRDLFLSEYMQRKLTALCTGIREAYGLTKHPETLPWEQYLINPIIPE